MGAALAEAQQRAALDLGTTASRQAGEALTGRFRVQLNMVLKSIGQVFLVLVLIIKGTVNLNKETENLTKKRVERDLKQI